MDKKYYLKIFLLLKERSRYDLSDLISSIYTVDIYEHLFNILIKVGLDVSESHQILGSLVLTLENNPYLSVDKDMDISLIEEPKSNKRVIPFIESGYYTKYGKHTIFESYSDLEAILRVRSGDYDDTDIYDTDYEPDKYDIDENDIKTR